MMSNQFGIILAKMVYLNIKYLRRVQIDTYSKCMMENNYLFMEKLKHLMIQE